jgi:dTDP-4-amino-4,6-dideoxygalactose transaminase
MIVTNSGELAGRMAMFRSHGITREPTLFLEESPGPWYYEQQFLGFNYRMTDIQAALGVSQLARIDEYIGRRNELARRYDVALKGLPITLPTVSDGNLSSFHLYVVRVREKHATRSHREIVDALRERGILVNLHYMPVHLQPYYRALGFVPGQFPEAEEHGKSAITLPLFPAMTDAIQDDVVRALKAVL